MLLGPGPAEGGADAEDCLTLLDEEDWPSTIGGRRMVSVGSVEVVDIDIDVGSVAFVEVPASGIFRLSSFLGRAAFARSLAACSLASRSFVFLPRPRLFGSTAYSQVPPSFRERHLVQLGRLPSHFIFRAIVNTSKDQNKKVWKTKVTYCDRMCRRY